MNMICDIRGREDAMSFIEIIKHYNPERLFIIAETRWLQAIKESGIHYTDLYVPRMSTSYEKNVCFNECIPVCADLLEEFAPYYDTTLNTIARHCGRQPSIHFLRQEVHRHIEYWNTILTKYCINLLVLHVFPHSRYDYILYALCNIKSIPTLLIAAAPVNGYAYLAKDVELSSHEVMQVYQQLRAEYINTDNIPLPTVYNDFYEKYWNRGHNDVHDYMKDKKSAYKMKYSIYTILSFLKKRKFRLLPDYVVSSIFTALYYQKWRKYSHVPDFNKKYVYVPLQLQPELTTCPLGGYYQHQNLFLKMLSVALPEDVFIYVKENPGQTILFRSLNYPESLIKIPRVILMPVDSNSAMLIENCLCVAACTGTPLLEGIFKNKPGLMFGNYINQYAPLIFHVKTFEDLTLAIEKIIKNEIVISDKELRLYLLALSKVCFLSQLRTGTKPHPGYWNKELAISETKNALINAIDKLGFVPVRGSL